MNPVQTLEISWHSLGIRDPKPDFLSVSFLDELRLTRYIALAGCTLLWWDWFLTFPDEVVHIWPTKWSAVKIIFIASRYVNLLSQPVVVAHLIGLTPTYSEMMCQIYVISDGMIVFLSLASVHALVVVRAWAIWGRQLWATATLISLYVIYAVTCSAIIITSHIIYAGNNIVNVDGTCVSLQVPTMWHVWIASLILEYACFGLTLASFWRHCRGTELAFRSLSPIRKKIYTAGLLFILFTTLIHVFDMILWTNYGRRPYNLLAVTFSYSLTNLAGQRFVLDLRRLNSERIPFSQRAMPRFSAMSLPCVISSVHETSPASTRVGCMMIHFVLGSIAISKASEGLAEAMFGISFHFKQNARSGFTIVPVSYSSSSTHYIYARSHSGTKKGTSNTLPDGRTLFLVNVPPDATERELGQLFKHCGTIERVIFDLDVAETHNDENESDSDSDAGEIDATAVAPEAGTGDQPRKRRKVAKDETPKVIPLPSVPLRTMRKTGRSAHLIFLDSSSLDRALASASTPRAWPSSSEEPLGLAHYMALYDSLRPPLDAVREHADSSMAVYEYELAKTKQKSKYRKGEAIVDEDGFTLVTRGGAYGQTLGGGVGVASKKFQESGQGTMNRNKKKDSKEKEGFYAFQKAEKQRNELMELKKRWEADKAKVEKLKASRRFKPY